MADLRAYSFFTSNGAPVDVSLSDVQFTIYRIKKSDNSVDTPVSAASGTFYVPGNGYVCYVLGSIDSNTYDYVWITEYTGTVAVDNAFCYGALTFLGAFIVTLSDGVSVVQFYKNLTKPVKKDTVTLTGSIKKLPKLVKTQSITLGNVLTKVAKPVKTQSITVGNMLIKFPKLVRTQSITLGNMLIKLPKQIKTQSISIGNMLVKLPKLVKAQSITITATKSRVLLARFLSRETITIGNRIIKLPKLVKKQTITLTGSVISWHTWKKVLTQSISLVESFKRLTRKVASEPFVEVGPEAKLRGAGVGGGFTLLDLTTAANHSGTLAKLYVYVHPASSTSTITSAGTFYGSGTSYTCRAGQSISNLSPGLNVVDVSLSIQMGDLIGVYMNQGVISYDSFASGCAFKEGNHCAPAGGQTYSLLDDKLSIHATGQYDAYIVGVVIKKTMARKIQFISIGNVLMKLTRTAKTQMLTIGNVIVKLPKLVKKQSISLSEAFKRFAKPVRKETITVGNVMIRFAKLVKLQSISLSALARKLLQVTKVQSISMSEKFIRFAKLVKKETISLAETLFVGMNAYLEEIITNIEDVRHFIWRAEFDAIEMIQHFGRGFFEVVSDSITFSEQYYHNLWMLVRNELINVYDSKYHEMPCNVTREDGFADCQATNWMDARNGVGDIFVDDTQSASMVCSNCAESIIAVSFLFFDCSVIPLDAEIVGADICLYGLNSAAFGHFFDVICQNGMPDFPHSPIATGDYFWYNYSGTGASINTHDWMMSGWNAIPMNASGLSWINIGGKSKFVVISNYVIDGVVPPNYPDSAYVQYSDYGGDYPPYLLVKYNWIGGELTKYISAVKEDAVSVAEDFVKFWNTIFADTMLNSDSVVKFISEIREEFIATNDLMKNALQTIKEERLVIDEWLHSKTWKALFDNITNAENFRKLPELLKSEIVSLVTSFKRFPYLVRRDVVTLTGIIKKLTRKARVETITLAGSVRKLPKAVRRETITLAGSMVRVPKKVIRATITLNGSLLKRGMKAVVHSILLTGAVARKVAFLSRKDTIFVQDSSQRALTRIVKEVMDLADVANKFSFYTAQDSMQLSDKILTMGGKILGEVVSLSEVVARAVYKEIADVLSIDSWRIAEYFMNQYDVLIVSEERAISLLREFKDNITIDESEMVVTFAKVLYEIVAVTQKTLEMIHWFHLGVYTSFRFMQNIGKHWKRSR